MKKMKSKNQTTLSFLFALILTIGCAFGILAQEVEKKERKVIELVDEENGIEKRATATYEDGQWSYEGNPEMIEKIKKQIESNEEGNSFYFHSGEGEKHVVKKKVVKSEDGEEIDIEVTVDGEGHGGQMMFIDEEGNVTKVESTGSTTWVESGESSSDIIIIKGGEAVDGEEAKKIEVIVNEGGSKEDILRELEIDTDEENIFITLEKTVEVEVENGAEAKSEKIIVIVKKFEMAEVKEEEIPKSMRKGFSVNEESTVNNVSFYPNPSDGEFQISGSVEKDAPVEILVTDMKGKAFLSKAITDHNGKLDYNINIRDKEPGVYLVRISQNGEGVVKKIVVK